MKKKVKKTIPEVIPKKYMIISDSIFKQRVHILINHTPKEYEKWLNKNKVKDITVKDFIEFSGWVSEFTTETGKTERILFIPKFQWTIKDQGTLIHEIVHIIIKIWSSNNIPFNFDTQEFLAHSIANLYEDIARKLLVIVKK